MPLTLAVARELGLRALSDAQTVDRLAAIAATGRTGLGVGAAYDPSASGRGRRLFAPYVLKDAQGGRRVQIEERYDYTRFEHRWYGDPLLEGAMWNEPLEGFAGEGMQTLFSMPFHRAGTDPAADAPSGVAFATVSLQEIEKVLDAMALGTSGYAFVFSAQGRYVAHPRRDLVRKRATVFETAFTTGDTALHSLAIRSLQGYSGLIESIDPATGQASWVVYEPIKATGWTLIVVYFEDAFVLNADRQRRDFFRITASAIGGAGLIGLALFTVLVTGRTLWLWAVATGVSVVLGGGIVALWWFSSRYPEFETGDRTKVFDIASAEQYLRAYERENVGLRLERIPTGIFVKSIEFLSSTNVAVTGYVWQRLPAPASTSPDFVLVEADKPDIREVSRRKEGAEEVVLWYFATNLREHFSYEKYPFDQQDVWLRLRPGALDRAAVLVPDLGAYTVSNPAAGPGIASGLVLPGWLIKESYFDYRPARYNANFGFNRIDVSAVSPELSFNTVVSRRFLGPFVSNIVPLTVAGVMVFALLIITSKSARLSQYAGFTAKDIIKGAAAVFFVISFQHIGLRNALASPRLIYFEYFYFVTYLGLLLVMLNGILFASNAGGRVLEFRDNLVPKIAFWPTTMACLFVVTLLVFY